MKTKLFFVVVLVLSLFSSFVIESVEAKGEVEQQWWWKKNRNQDEEFPKLRGGNENTQRNRQQPVSNIELQQQYPETVVLQGPNVNKVALTFDDGPDPRFTGQVLDVLKEYNVPATFS